MGTALALAPLMLLVNHSACQLEPLQTPEPVQPWSMGFWTGANAVPVSDLDWGGLTHVAHVAVAPNPDGSLALTCGLLPCPPAQFEIDAARLLAPAHENNIKVLLSVANVPGARWQGAAADNLTVFLDNIMNVVDTYGYDGVDVDWENKLSYPAMTALLSGLRDRLGTRLLAANAVGADAKFWGSVHQYLDRVSVMTYDMVGVWNPYPWFNSALYHDPCHCVWSVDLSRERMTAAGVPPAKLNIGIPFYGYVSAGGGSSAPRQPWGTTPPALSQVNYNNLLKKYDLSNPLWDRVAQVPYVTMNNGWITFDNEQSIKAKVHYAKTHNLGGWIIWALDQDYMPDAEVKHPLLTAVKNAMAAENATE